MMRFLLFLQIQSPTVEKGFESSGQSSAQDRLTEWLNSTPNASDSEPFDQMYNIPRRSEQLWGVVPPSVVSIPSSASAASVATTRSPPVQSTFQKR